MNGVKFILLGNSAVGKTSIMLSFTGKPIRMTHISTIGIDMDKRIFEYQGEDIEVKVWDTAGQEKYQNSLPMELFKRLNGVLLVYDVTNRKSFDAVSSWVQVIEEKAPDNTSIVLVGNKIDKPNHQVTEEEGRLLANSFQAPFLTTSAKEGINVEAAFHELIKETLVKNPNLFENKQDRGLVIGKDDESRRRICC
jgi:small GTP-binding protein